MSTEDLKKIFDEFDIDKNGTISLEELGSVAEKLGAPISPEELKGIKQLLDTNNDGKISFDEFEFWWNKGHKGKLMNLIYLKAKAMKMTNFIKNKFSQADISLENHKGRAEADKIDISVQFGEPTNDCIHFGFNLYSKGSGEKFERQKIKMILGNMGDSLNQSTYGFVFKLPSKNPQQAKVQLQKVLTEILINPNSPIDNINDNPFYSYKSETNDKELIIFIQLRSQLQNMAAPMTQTSEGMFSALGEDFYSKTHFDFTINSSCDSLLEGNLAQNLMKGFSFKVYTQANQSALGKIRKLGEKISQMPAIVNLFTLIRSKKFHLKIRTPKQMEIFMKKMGIQQAIQGLPCLIDLLEEISPKVIEQCQYNPIVDMARKTFRFALKNVQNNVEIYGLLGKIGTMKLNFSAKNITRVHSILFNEA